MTFPAPRDPDSPIRTDTAGHWLRKAEALAEGEGVPGAIARVGNGV